MFYTLTIPAKFCVVAKSSCQNQNPYQDQDYDSTLNFNSRTTFDT